MLPEQHDILWSFLTLMSSVFALYVFVSVIRQCRTNEKVNGMLCLAQCGMMAGS